MFGDKKKKATRPTGNVETLIGQHAHIRGDLHFTGGLYIEGIVEGAVIAEGNGDPAILTLAEGGRIEGEVRVPVVILNGCLVGDVHATQRIELGATAKVEGNVHYVVVEMLAGCMLTGRLIHESGEPRKLSGPSEKESE